MTNWSSCFVLWLWWAGSALILPLLLKSAALSNTTPHWTKNDQGHAAFLITHFNTLFKSNCSSLANVFICASYSPLCQNPNYRLLPYQRFCFHVYYSCIYLLTLSGLPWPSSLNCSEFLSPPLLWLSPPSLPLTNLTPKQPFSLQSLPSTRSSVSPSSSSTTPTATSSPSHHLPILGLSLSFVILVMFLRLCFSYTGHPCRHLCFPHRIRPTITLPHRIRPTITLKTLI